MYPWEILLLLIPAHTKFREWRIFNLSTPTHHRRTHNRGMRYRRSRSSLPLMINQPGAFYLPGNVQAFSSTLTHTSPPRRGQGEGTSFVTSYPNLPGSGFVNNTSLGRREGVHGGYDHGLAPHHGASHYHTKTSSPSTQFTLGTVSFPHIPTRPPGIMTSNPRVTSTEGPVRGAHLGGDPRPANPFFTDIPGTNPPVVGMHKGDGDKVPPTPTVEGQFHSPPWGYWDHSPTHRTAPEGSGFHTQYYYHHRLSHSPSMLNMFEWMDNYAPFRPTPLTSTPTPSEGSEGEGEEEALRLFIDTQGSSSSNGGHTVISTSPIHRDSDHPTTLIESKLAHLSIDAPPTQVTRIEPSWGEGRPLGTPPPPHTSTSDHYNDVGPGRGCAHTSSHGSTLRTPPPCSPFYYNSSSEHDTSVLSDVHHSLHVPTAIRSDNTAQACIGSNVDRDTYREDPHRVIPSSQEPSLPYHTVATVGGLSFDSQVRDEPPHGIEPQTPPDPPPPSRVGGARFERAHRYVQTDVPPSGAAGVLDQYGPPHLHPRRGEGSPTHHQDVGRAMDQKALNDFGIQTDFTPRGSTWDLFIPYQGSRLPLFPDLDELHYGRSLGGSKPEPLKIQVNTHSNRRLFSPPQEDDQESLTTTNSVDALLDQVKTLMTDAARYEVRATHLEQLVERDILTPWATTVRPYPPYIQNNVRLLNKIRDVRIEAARRIQELAHADFDRQATRLQTEGQTLISTIDGLMKGKAAAQINARLEHVAALVGKTKAELTTQLYERRNFLAIRQPTPKDWDDFFRYSIAYRRSKGEQAQGFEVTPSDRRQAERENRDEVRRNLRDDEDPGETTPASTQPRNNKKRKREHKTGSTSGPYRIPKRPDQGQPDHTRGQRQRDTDHHRQDKGRRNQRDPSPPATSRRHPDFGDSRPATTHRVTYYRSDHDAQRGRDNYHHNRGPQRTYNQQRTGRDQEERDRQLRQLQDQLDMLRRN